jgi:hypothetical protein
MKLGSAAFALALPFASTALAEGFSISSPVDCDLTDICYIQQYVDSDPSSGASDFRCSTLTYDGHKGTDFALPNRAMIADDIPVVASAAGRIKGVRDGMDDAGYSDETASDIDGRECGNGVVIDHGDGWETQYCHLKKGSVRVKSGEQVIEGQELGYVGQSGKAAFPHVHLSVRKDGNVVDPFDPDGKTVCATPGDSTLWKDRPEYRAGGLIGTGFSDAVPEFDAIKAGTAGRRTLTTDAPALVVWGHMFGSQPGDIMNLSITGPDGMVIADDVTLTRAQAQSFRAIGKKRRGSWTPGTYTGTVTLIRGPQIISQKTAILTIN